jgi:methionine--tRNA ligase beta chain
VSSIQAMAAIDTAIRTLDALIASLEGGRAEAQPPVAAAPALGLEVGEAFTKAHLVVGRVLSAAPVEGSDKLYLCSVDVGEGKPRQVVTGLRKFVAQEVLSTAHVVVILNLKPAKLAGHVSEAMILAAESTAVDGAVRVTLLAPPSSAAPGERVVMPAGPPAVAPPKECKSAAWAVVKSALRVEDERACLGAHPLCCGTAGFVTVPGVPDGASIG